MSGSGVILVRSIKPAKLRVDKVRLELLNALRAEGRVVERELDKCVETWNAKPKFTSVISLAGGDAAVLTAPDGSTEENTIFQWVDQGTKPHRIPKSGIRRLSYQKYKPKTQPNSTKSGAGGPYGEYTHRQWVFHPGITARNFSEVIQKRRTKRFRDAMLDAVRRGVEKATAQTT